MKKVVSIIILFVICCYSCSVFAESYKITSVKDSVVVEQVISGKQGKIENKITKVDDSTQNVYGEINFINKASDSKGQKLSTEIYIMLPENIVTSSEGYALYKTYVEEFAKKVYAKDASAKIGIIGIKGTVNSHTEVDGKWIINDDDEGDIPGSADNAEIVAKLTNNLETLKTGLNGMNPEKKNFYTNLQAAIGLARDSYSSNSNKILISLFDNVPLICNGVQDTISHSPDDNFEELVKAQNSSIVSATKEEMLGLKDDNIAFILLRPENTSYNQTWWDVDTGKIVLEYDGSQHVIDLYGTMENPTYGKMYSLSSDSLENIVTKYIYEDVVEEMKTTLENVEIQVVFSKEVFDNFNITSLNTNDKTIDISKLKTEGKIIWKIEKLNEDETDSFKYKLELKKDSILESLLNKNINMNTISISLGDKSKDINLTQTPTFMISREQTNNGNSANSNSNNNSNFNSNSNNNLANDPTIANEKFPKAGKVVLAFALISLIGCAGIGIAKMINLRDVK